MSLSPEAPRPTAANADQGACAKKNVTILLCCTLQPAGSLTVGLLACLLAPRLRSLHDALPILRALL